MIIPVTVIVPTWRRAEKLARMLRSVAKQTARPRQIEVVEDEAGEFAIGIWNRLAPEVTSGAFVYVTDDVELDPCCLEAASRTLMEWWPDGDGMIGFNQRNIQGKAGTAQSAMGMVGATFLDRFSGRRPFCPDYSRFHFDTELGLYARSKGRFRFESSASLVHWHPGHYRSELDETHARVRDPDEVALDKAVWDERRKRQLLWGRDDILIRDQVRVRA